MTAVDLQQLCESVRAIAREAGEATMTFYKSADLQIDNKDDGSQLTEADMASHHIIVERLEALSDWPILSEEGAHDGDRLDSEYVWIVDPIDGTKDFVNHTDEFAVMIGLARNGESVLGVVYAPALEEMTYAYKGGGAFRGNEQLHVSDRGVGSMRMVASRSHFTENMQRIADNLGIKNIDRMGSIGVKMSRIAAGATDLMGYSTSKLGEWDVCAGACIVTEAGGIVGGMQGEVIEFNKQDPHTPHGLLVHNGTATEEVHAQVAELTVI